MSDFVSRKKLVIDEFEKQKIINNGWTYFLNDLKESLTYIEILRAENEAFRTTLEIYAMTNSAFPEYVDIARLVLEKYPKGDG